MAQLNIRIDDDSRDEFDALARAKGLSTSDLMRDLIAQALGRNGDRPGADQTPQSLSAYQRRHLALQHEILANLVTGPEWEAAYHREMVEILNSGYTAEYYKIFQMMEPEMTPRESKLVYNILEMFTTIERSLAALQDEERASLGRHPGTALKFRGFDFNDPQEGKLASYAHHLIKGGRWTNLAEYFSDKNERGNSHMPTLAGYQRMVSVWQPLWDRMLNSHGGPNEYRFTVAELQQIVAAWPYPGNRD